MPEWCPQCNAMLSPGTAICPRCGHELSVDEGEEKPLGAKDIFNVSLYVLRLAAIPIILIIVVGVICVSSGK